MDKKLLERYFTGGTCTPEELIDIRVYLSNPDQQLQEWMTEEWEQAGGLVQTHRQEATLQKIMIATGQVNKQPASQAPVVSMERRKRVAVYQIAAAVAGALLITVIGFYLYHLNSRTTTMAERAWSTVRNDAATIKLITMPEGTRIWLNSHSSISYPSGFAAGNTREVRLSGEAYFNVTKDPTHPFTVHTGQLRTTVLGTSFTVTAWPRTTDIQVALVEGKVRVEGHDNSIRETLIPGDLLTYTKADGHVRKTTGGVRRDMYEWIDGKIILTNTPVIEALKELEQVYGVTIQADAAVIGNRKLTGKFIREDIGTVLHNLLFAAELTYHQKDSIYIITTP